MNCEVFIIDEGAEGQRHEEFQKPLVYVAIIFFLALISQPVHYSLKLKKLVIVRP
jgi:hypothetical protein